MSFTNPDIATFKQHLDGCIDCAVRHTPRDHASIKVQSLLDITIYIMATRFLEGAVKNIIYNCGKMKGMTETELEALYNRLKSFNNPEFSHIRELFNRELGYDIINDKGHHYTQRDISLLNEICMFRHRNAHASSDPREWYNTNNKSIANFQGEYVGLLNIISYLDKLIFNHHTNVFEYR